MSKKILIFGDSIAHGACDSELGGWVERLKVYVGTNTDDKSVYNLGVSGNNTEDLLKRFVHECNSRAPHTIVFAIGINDSQYIQSKANPRISITKFEENLKLLINKAKEFAKEIIFVGLTKIDESKTMPIPWGPTKYYDEENTNLYNSIIEKVCGEKNIKFIPLFDLLSNEDLHDGLHPNTEGHRKIFERVRDELNKILEIENA